MRVVVPATVHQIRQRCLFAILNCPMVLVGNAWGSMRLEDPKFAFWPQRVPFE